MFRKRGLLLSGAASIMISGTAFAQAALPASSAQASASQTSAPTGAGLDEIIVTATKTGETAAQKTPLAISVFSADRLNGSLALNVKDLVALTPNLNLAQTTTNAQIYIRGIGTNNVFVGSDPDVTVQLDGVYLARAYAQFTDFIDVQRVEVLRGPQGTLYGRNAVGGTINIISRLPSDEFHAKVQLAGGNFGMFQGQAYISGALVPGKLQFSLTGNYLRHDSYFDNIVPGKHGVGDADRGGVRGQLRFVPTDNVGMITRADWNKSNDHPDTFDHLLAPVAVAPLATSTIGTSKVALNDPEVGSTRMWGVSEEINFRLSSALTLKSLTAYRDSRTRVLVDNDGTELSLIRAIQQDSSKQLSQELNLNLNLDRFAGVVGLFYFHEHEIAPPVSDTPPSIITPPARSSLATVLANARGRSLAGFAQGTYNLTDALSITAGVRYTQDRKALDQSLTVVSQNPATPGAVLSRFAGLYRRTFHAVTPKFGIQYQITPTVLAFASATRGYKSGGTNFAARNIQTLGFDPEYIWSYEGGVKSDWLDHRLRVNVTAFKYDYKALQVQSLLGSGISSISNAATAKVKGLEIETMAKPVPELLLTANFALLDAKYDSFPNASVPANLIPYLVGNPNFTPAPPGGSASFNASGNRLNVAPKSSFSGSAQYDLAVGPGKAFVRGEYYWQARTYYDPSNALIMSQKPYDLVNLAVGYNSANSLWGVQLVAKNVTKTHYLITVAANGVVPAGLAGAPRTIVLQLTKSW